MWSKLEQVLNDPGYKRLGLALAVSVVLHFFLLGKLDLTLPDLKKEMHLIEASIQMPKAVVKTVETSIPEEAVIPEPVPPAKPPEPVEPPETEAPNQVHETEVTDAAPNPEPVTENPLQPQT